VGQPGRFVKLLEPVARPPSVMTAWLASTAELPRLSQLEPVLREHGVSAEPVPSERPEETGWGARLGGPGGLELRCEVAGADGLHADLAKLGSQSRRRLSASRYSLSTSMRFGTRPLEDWHRQLQLMVSLAPRAVAYVDVSAAMAHEAAWALDAAAAPVAPPPRSLYAVHALMPESRKARGALHTHGLARCGLLELEMLDVTPRALAPCALLLNAVAALLLDRGLPAPGEPFEVGRQLSLVWLPWDEARQPSGRSSDGRGRRDEHHRGPTAVLFAPGRKPAAKLRSPACYARRLAGDATFYLARRESARRAGLAHERLASFKRLFRIHAPARDWTFLVKLEMVDGGARELLWFELHALGEALCDVTLVSRPAAVSRRRKGDRASHSLDDLRDWSITCPQGRFGPDTIGQLLRELQME